MLTDKQIETIRQNTEDAVCSYADKAVYFKRSYDVLTKDVPALLEQIVLLRDDNKRLERKMIELAEEWVRLLQERNKYKREYEFYEKSGLKKVAETLGTKVESKEESSSQSKYKNLVDEAKGDVAFWLSTAVERVPMIKGGYGSYIPEHDTVEFIVNRKNRKVTALIRDEYGIVFAKGIAKCSPEDRFNSHIGRAIALRRALGLGVPFYFSNIPQPTETRVGDVVKY